MEGVGGGRVELGRVELGHELLDVRRGAQHPRPPASPESWSCGWQHAARNGGTLRSHRGAGCLVPVADCGLQVTGCRLRVACFGCGLQGCRLQVAGEARLGEREEGAIGLVKLAAVQVQRPLRVLAHLRMHPYIHSACACIHTHVHASRYVYVRVRATDVHETCKCTCMCMCMCM